MACNEDSVSKILSILSHPIRREILSFIHEKGESSFTDLLNVLQVDTGKLSFHLRTLSAFTEQSKTGKYKLSKSGENALRIVRDIEGWAEGATISSKTLQIPYASFEKRSAAFLIDASIMLSVTLLFALPELVPFWLGGGGAFALNLGAVPFVTLGLLFVYSTLLEGFNGQTLGKRVVGLKVVRVDGKGLRYEHSAVRNFGKTFLLPLDILLGLKHEKYLRYFDKFAGTNVVDLRPAPKPLPTTVLQSCEKELEVPSQVITA
ncbi:MAG TPA: RDD family protein [Candidatus Sulfotelmatobacter sp.]|nr:RDD family protein [Candidatus Sulfotelmatobacter sp.]